MITMDDKRIDKGYEVQFYDADGNNANVARCDTTTELAQYLARCCWGCSLIPIGSSSAKLPTIWLNGRKWCFTEYSSPIEWENLPI